MSQTGFRVINNTTDVTTVLAFVTHGNPAVAGFKLQAGNGIANAATQPHADIGVRGIYFYDNFTFDVLDKTEITLVAGTNTKLTISGSSGSYAFALGSY